MQTYSLLREFADSWVLLMMTLFFLGVILWVVRPGSRAVHQDTANIPFRNDDKPGCGNTCANCTCTTTRIEDLKP